MSLMRNEKAKYYAGSQHRPQSKVLRFTVKQLAWIMFSWFLKHDRSKPLFYTVHGQGWNSEKRIVANKQLPRKLQNSCTDWCWHPNASSFSFGSFAKFGGYNLISMRGSFQSWWGSQKPQPNSIKLYKIAYS